MSSPLATQHCVPCEGGTPALTRDAVQARLPEIAGWSLSPDGKQILRKYKFKDFEEAMIFVNAVANLAEREGHHPDIHVSWNKVKLVLTTHAIGGLSDNDLILAAKINELPPV